MSTIICLGLLAAYLVAVYWLSIVGMRKTHSLESFAIGNRDMGPITVGIVMASSIASTATFVINPGFVYTHGVSALVHYGVAAQAGVAVGLLAVTRGFRRFGAERGCLTIPHWIGERYGSRALALAFAAINLLSIAFVVLIMVGCAMIVAALTGLGYVASLVAVLVVVFSYVLMGGTYAHAYTNIVQAAMMAVVALILFGSGLHHFAERGVIGTLQSVSPDWAAVVNPSSTLYGSVFAVFVSAFVVTFALMMQPHILSKVLYLRGDRDVRRFLLTTIATGFVFSLCLFVGVYARVGGLGLAESQQDQVVTTYVLQAFGDGMGAELVSGIVLLALLAAGMSTLDGILVALSAMVTHDLLLKLPGGRARDPAAALRASRWVLVAVGLVAFVVAIDPPALVGLFAQKGVYGLAAAAFVPVVFGVLWRGAISATIAAVAASAALATHVVLLVAFGVDNPATSACQAILASVMIALVMLTVQRWRRPASGES